MLGYAPPENYWKTVESQRLLLEFLTLRDAAGGRRGAAIKRTLEWQTQAQQFLLELELWNGAREPVEREYFDEKSLLFDAYADLVPPGALRTPAIVSAIDFLRRSDTGRVPRALWFANLSRVIERRDPGVLAALEQSGHPLISLYARAERLLTGRRR